MTLYSIWITSPRIGLDGEQETIKKSLLRSSTNPKDYYDPSKAFALPPLGLDWMGSQRGKVC